MLLFSVVPCLTGECEILTPDGYIRIDHLKKDQMIAAPPDGRSVSIKEVFSSEIIGTKENAPYTIPKDFFCQGVPTKDIQISPHHLYFYNGKWNGQTIKYYHIRLEDYPTEKLICQGLAVDSWEGEKEMTY